MKLVTRECWLSDKGRELMVRDESGEYRVIVATCDRDTLLELGCAITHAAATDKGGDANDAD